MFSALAPVFYHCWVDVPVLNSYHFIYIKYDVCFCVILLLSIKQRIVHDWCCLNVWFCLVNDIIMTANECQSELCCIIRSWSSVLYSVMILSFSIFNCVVAYFYVDLCDVKVNFQQFKRLFHQFNHFNIIKMVCHNIYLNLNRFIKKLNYVLCSKYLLLEKICILISIQLDLFLLAK